MAWQLGAALSCTPAVGRCVAAGPSIYPAIPPTGLMCELPGAKANTPTDVTFTFADVARRADVCADGFGMAFAEGHSGWPLVERQRAAAAPVA